MSKLKESDFPLLDVLKYFTYLDALREIGETNMFGAGPYLQRGFPELDKTESRQVLMAWADTFDGKTDAEDRAYTALGKNDE